MESKVLNLPGQRQLEVGDDVVYVITNRYDPSAPEGLKEIRTTKFPNESGVDHLAIAYEDSVGNGIYDTGLYADSPVLSNMPLYEAEALESDLQELIVKPLERKYGPNSLSHIGEVKFWDNYEHTIKVGNRYHTNNPQHLLALYLAIVHGFVVDREENSPRYKDAAFCYVNMKADRTLESEKDSDAIEAIKLYGRLKDDKAGRLQLVFEFLGLPIVKKGKGINYDATDSTIRRLTNSADSYKFNKELIKAAKDSFSKEGFEKLKGYSRLKALIKAGLIVKGNDNIYRLDEIELGISLDTSTEMYVDSKNNPEVKKLVDLKIESIDYVI